MSVVRATLGRVHANAPKNAHVSLRGYVSTEDAAGSSGGAAPFPASAAGAGSWEAAAGVTSVEWGGAGRGCWGACDRGRESGGGCLVASAPSQCAEPSRAARAGLVCGAGRCVQREGSGVVRLLRRGGGGTCAAVPCCSVAACAALEGHVAARSRGAAQPAAAVAALLVTLSRLPGCRCRAGGSASAGAQGHPPDRRPRLRRATCRGCRVGPEAGKGARVQLAP